MKKLITLILGIAFIYSCSTNSNDNSSNPVVPAILSSSTIGSQIWQSTNLNVTTYRDGTPIPQVSNPSSWARLTTGAWCYYNNDPANEATYGKLYNWYAVAGIHDNDPNTPNKVLAPVGWHIPTDTEWTTLSTFLGGETIAGGKMKEIGTVNWYSPNTGATNSSSFNGLPGGYITVSGNVTSSFNFIKQNGVWWSSSELLSSSAWFRELKYNGQDIFRSDFNKSSGFSVRCVKD